MYKDIVHEYFSDNDTENPRESDTPGKKTTSSEQPKVVKAKFPKRKQILLIMFL